MDWKITCGFLLDTNLWLLDSGLLLGVRPLGGGLAKVFGPLFVNIGILVQKGLWDLLTVLMVLEVYIYDRNSSTNV